MIFVFYVSYFPARIYLPYIILRYPYSIIYIIHTMIRMILYCVDYSMIYSVYPYDTTRVNFGGPHMFSSRYNIV